MLCIWCFPGPHSGNTYLQLCCAGDGDQSDNNSLQEQGHQCKTHCQTAAHQCLWDYISVWDVMGVWYIHHFRRLTSIAMFTSSQGFFIFIFFCVIVKEGRELWINLLCCGHKLPSTPLYKNSGGEGSTGMQNNPMKLLKLSSMYFCSPLTTSSMQNDKTPQCSDTSAITM